MEDWNNKGGHNLNQDRQTHQQGKGRARQYYQDRPETDQDMPPQVSESFYQGRYSGQKHEDLYDPVDEMFASGRAPHRAGRVPDKHRQSARPTSWSGRRNDAGLNDEMTNNPSGQGAEFQHPYGNYWEPSGHFIGRGPRGYKRSDDRILEDVCETLTWDPEIDARDIEVSVEEGEVYLSGTVPDRRTKRWAEQSADEVPGVVDIHNRITIARQDQTQNASNQSH